jgi:hypothetical protein
MGNGIKAAGCLDRSCDSFSVFVGESWGDRMSLRSGGVTERLVKFGAGRYDGFYVGWFGEGEPKDVDE